MQIKQCSRITEQMEVLLKQLQQLTRWQKNLVLSALSPKEIQIRSRRRKRQFDYEAPDDPILDPEKNFRVNFFNQILDTAIQSVNDRFIQLTSHSDFFGFLYDIKKLETCDKKEVFKYCIDLQSALTSENEYSADIDATELCDEVFALARRINEKSSPKVILDYLCGMDLVALFPNMYVALRILHTLPITVASAERSFSKLKLIKTYLRSTMSQDRLVGLATISIERTIAEELDMTGIIQKFASAKARKAYFS